MWGGRKSSASLTASPVHGSPEDPPERARHAAPSADDTSDDGSGKPVPGSAGATVAPETLEASRQRGHRPCGASAESSAPQSGHRVARATSPIAGPLLRKPLGPR